MKQTRRTIGMLAASAVLATVAVAPVSAAPNGLDISATNCTVDHNPGGTYTSYIHLSAQSPSGNQYQFNGVRASATTNGGTRWTTITAGWPAVEWMNPTSSFWRDVTFANIPEYAKSVTFEVYNGSVLKGSVTVRCQRRNF